LWNSWDSLTNHCFFGPRPWPNRPLAEKKFWEAKKFRPKRMKGGRDIRPFIAHRVTKWQSHIVTPLPLLIWVGEIFLCPFLINSPTRFAHRGINVTAVVNIVIPKHNESYDASPILYKYACKYWYCYQTQTQTQTVYIYLIQLDLLYVNITVMWPYALQLSAMSSNQINVISNYDFGP
jgi:hypothetical protein